MNAGTFGTQYQVAKLGCISRPIFSDVEYSECDILYLIQSKSEQNHEDFIEEGDFSFKFNLKVTISTMYNVRPVF